MNSTKKSQYDDKKLMKSLFFLIFFFLFSCGKKTTTTVVTSSSSDNLICGSAPTTGTGSDPLTQYQWHLNNTGQSSFSSSSGTSGNDLNFPSSYSETGSGIKVLISDDTVERFHHDLYANWSENLSLNFYNTNFSATPSPCLRTSDSHGTSVAGIIGAVKNNGVGGQGIAPNVQMSGANALSDEVTATNSVFLAQADVEVDIVNMSWGTEQSEYSDVISGYEAQVVSAATTHRSGKGTLFVKSAGNDFVISKGDSSGQNKLNRFGNSNFDADNTIPQIFVVGALDADGVSASYSSSGSNLLVSAPGGETGTSNPAIVTTDRLGCNFGYAKSTSSNLFNKDSHGSVSNPDCKFTSLFNGTSSAAPMLTGSLALVLEKFPNLNWRQIKYLIAHTARQTDSSRADLTTPPGLSVTDFPSGLKWEYGWKTNGANLKFHNWYGFGAIDLDNMLNFDINTIPSMSTEETKTVTDSTDKNITDHSAVATTYSFNITENFTIEDILLTVSMTHSNLEEIMIELVSPGGTPMKSIFLNSYSSLRGETEMTNQRFLTNAFYGMNISGTWTLNLYDVKPGNTGTVQDISLKFRGY